MKKAQPSAQSTGRGRSAKKTRSTSRRPSGQDTPSAVLLRALIASRHGTPGAQETYLFYRQRIDRLNDPQTPWEQRLKYLDELEAAGGNKWADWPRLKADWKFGGREFQIPISAKQWRQLTILKGREYSDFLANILREWFRVHPELQHRVIENITELHFFGKWVACQVWGREPAFSRWLINEIVEKALRDVEPSSIPAILRADDVTAKNGVFDVKGEIKSTAYEFLFGDEEQGEPGLIPAWVHYITNSLEKYWRRCVKNHILGQFVDAKRYKLTFDEPIPSKDGENSIAVVDTLEDIASFEAQAHRRTEEKESALQIWRRRCEKLTARQHKIVLTKAPLDLHEIRSNQEVAELLGLSLSTVEKELQKIRQKLTPPVP